LEEIILIDDASDMGHLGAKLDQYMAKFEKVKMVRWETGAQMMQ
jgi:hypothetical protein